MRKMFVGYKTGGRLGEDLCTFQRGREIVLNYKFSEVSALRKGRPVAYSLEATSLMFSQAEGNVKTLLGKSKVASIFQSGFQILK